MPSLDALFRGRHTLGLRELVSLPDAKVDIIFIHGLRGDSFKTWLHGSEERGVYWPTELLSRDFPSARILTFGYDVDVVQFFDRTGQGSLRDHASTLVGEVATSRDPTCGDRPIIVVAHSLGGILAKKALLMSATAVEESSKTLDRNIRGLCFLGTPHRGSSHANLGAIIGSALSLFPPFFRVNSSPVDLLRPGSELLTDVHEEFCVWLRKNSARANVTCFWEELKHPRLGMIVPRASASIDGYPLRPLWADHVGMCKFSSTYDTGYRRVSGELKLWLGQDVIPAAESNLEQGGRVGTGSSPLRAHQGSSPDAEVFLRGIWFRDIFAREDGISPPLDGTCLWIFDNAAYKSWKSSAKGVFWTLGLPGTGKSVMIKHLVSSARIEASKGSTLILSHFFSATGTPLQHSIDGLLRSLIYQLLLTDPSAFTDRVVPELTRKGANPDEAWTFEDLTSFLDKLLLYALQKRDVRIYIDGLQECRGDAEGTRNMVKRFQDMPKRFEKTRCGVAVCLSSRYYPAYAPRDVESCVQMEKENRVDIDRFVSSEIALAEAVDIPELQIRLKAHGSFLWASSVTKRAVSLEHEGHGLDQIHDFIKHGIPGEIMGIYEGLLQTVTTTEISLTLKILQLMGCSPHESIDLSELVRASNAPDALGEQVHDSTEPITVVELARRLPNVSCGLMRLDWGGTVPRDSALGSACVEFIHPTAKEYMWNHGFTLLDPNHPTAEAAQQRASLCVYQMHLSSTLASFRALELRWQALVQKHDEKSIQEALQILTSSPRFASVLFRNQETLDGVLQIGDPDLVARFALLQLENYEPEDGYEASEAFFPSYDRTSDTNSDWDWHNDHGYENPPGDDTDPAVLYCLAEAGLALTGRDTSVDTCMQGVLDWLIHAKALMEKDIAPDPDLATALGLLQRSSEQGFRLFWRQRILLMASRRDFTALIRILADQLTARAQDPATKAGLLEAVHAAAARGSVTMLAVFMDEYGMDVESPHRSNTLLITALYNGSLEAVRLLLQRGGSVLVRSRDGTSAVTWGLRGGEKMAIVVLEHLKKMRSTQSPAMQDQDFVDDCNLQMGEALASAMRDSESKELVRALLDAGADSDVVALPNEGWRPLHVAASNGDSVLVNLLLKAGASVDLKDAKGRTPLHLAVMQGHLTACTVLLLRGADVNARDEDHATPLLLAKEAFDSKNFPELVRALLNFRARVEDSFGSGTTTDPLMRDSLMGYAIRRDSDVILKLLLDRGAAAVFEAKYQQTTMGVCISHSRVACLRLLISRPDYDINEMDYLGYALIHYCAGGMSWREPMCDTLGMETVEKLLKRPDLNVNLPSSNGELPTETSSRQAAKSPSSLPFMRLLLAREDIDINATDVRGERTALHRAVENQHTEMAKMIISDPRTDINMSFGEVIVYTALYFAAKTGNLEIVKLLLNDPRFRMVNEPDKHGSYHTVSPLQAAVFARKKNPGTEAVAVMFDSAYLDIVGLLCKRCDTVFLNRRTVDGTALDIANSGLRARKSELRHLEELAQQRQIRKPWLSYVSRADDWGNYEDSKETLAKELDEYDSTHYGETEGSSALECRVQDLEKEIAARQKMVDIIISHGGTATEDPQFVGWCDSGWYGVDRVKSASYISAVRLLCTR
ncbi:hypothetical protein B0T26DRAFT_725797 [Lasiosphaeria miniovina]|uniref:Nephrocystin 3-like N-terminal domain-containing protein n=1 Tax=Lasiosphaeria miniovina TaxID=1954250 RepID=A0AA39ZYW9_9PEZI|nr:uncharacterized protein B0T26DRAFT_725797 [Lasiosphaeria miniovina]KAK0706216.1 hypothetical protein B0T26DRAFT_725797 [Lasiosphaeria miniovina]